MDCVFCKIINKDIPAKIHYEDEKVIVFEDIEPSAPIHLLIVPKEHIASVNEIKEDNRGVMGDLFMTAQKIAKNIGVERSGYKLVVNVEKGGGQIVFHIHMHLLAGWKKEPSLY